MTTRLTTYALLLMIGASPLDLKSAELDSIATLAIQRCHAFGYSRGSKDFAACAEKQTALLTENPSTGPSASAEKPQNSASTDAGAAFSADASDKKDTGVTHAESSSPTTSPATPATPSPQPDAARILPKIISMPRDMDQRNLEFRRKSKISAAVTVVRACVDVSGKVYERPTVALSSGYRQWDELAVQLASEATYQPGTENGKPHVFCGQYRLGSIPNAVDSNERGYAPNKAELTLAGRLPITVGNWELKSLVGSTKDTYLADIALQTSITDDSADLIYSIAPILISELGKFFCSDKSWFQALRNGHRVSGLVRDVSGRQLFSILVHRDACGFSWVYGFQ